MILRCLERVPADRFAGTVDVARALEGDDATTTSPVRRVRRLSIGLAVLLVLGVAGATLLILRSVL